MSKSPSLRRIKADIRELSIDPSDQYHAAPLEHDMFEWHFTIRGAPDTDFAGGIYHGRILLPPEYPFKPPNIVFLTPSGRFECGVKVCLSFSAHHPELWQPAWGIRLILEALISFLPTPADGAIGALDWTSEERKKLAKESVKFRCPVCCCEGETCADLVPELKAKGGDGDAAEDEKAKKKTKFQEEIEKLKMLQFQNHAVEESEVKEEEEGKREEATESKSAQGSGTDAAPKPPTDDATKKEEPKETVSDQEQTPEEENTKRSFQQSTTSPPPVPPDEHSQPRATDNNTISLEPRNAPLPPPAPSNSARAQEVAATTPVNAPAPTPVDNVIVSDSLLHGMIGFLGVVVLVLLRQAQELVEEAQALGLQDNES